MTYTNSAASFLPEPLADTPAVSHLPVDTAGHRDPALDGTSRRDMVGSPTELLRRNFRQLKARVAELQHASNLSIGKPGHTVDVYRLCNARSALMLAENILNRT